MMAVYLALATPFVATLGFMLWMMLSHARFTTYHRSRRLELPALGRLGTLRYYRRLVVATVIVTWWTLRAAGRDGLRRPEAEASGPPVLCIHGFFRNGTCMWGVRRALERLGRPTRAVSMGRPFQPIEGYAPRLQAALREMIAAYPGEKIDLVAHSMGGVVLRLVLAEHPDLATAVGRIVTLGSPHRGTAVVRGLAFAPEHRQLDLGSPFLASLPDFRESAPDVEAMTLAAECDFVVYPKSTTHLPGSRAIDLPHANHQSLLTEPEVLKLIAKLLGC